MYNFHVAVFIHKYINLEEALFEYAISVKAKSCFFKYKELFTKTLNIRSTISPLYVNPESEKPYILK